MGAPADYAIIVMLVPMGVALWTLLERVSQLQRDLEALRHRLDSRSPHD